MGMVIVDGRASRWTKEEREALRQRQLGKKRGPYKKREKEEQDSCPYKPVGRSWKRVGKHFTGYTEEELFELGIYFN